MPRPPIARDTLADRIAAQLRAEILAGQYPPGALLPSQRRLAEEFGASINLVREALRTLQADGLIQVRHGAGMFVSDAPLTLSLDQMDRRSVVEARCMLEVGAVEQVIERLTTAGLRRLEEIIARAAIKSEAGESVLEEELDFHRALLELAGNPAVAHLARIINEAFRRAVAELPPEIAGRYRPFAEEHGHLVDLLRAGDVPGTQQALRQHILAGSPPAPLH